MPFNLLLFTIEYEKKSSGVFRKIAWEVSAFQKQLEIHNAYLGYFSADQADTYCVVCERNEAECIEKWHLQPRKFYYQKNREVYARTLDFVRRHSIDLVCIRYPQASNDFVRFLKALKSQGVGVVLEFPTYPFLTERKLFFIRYLREKNWKAAVGTAYHWAEELICLPRLKQGVDLAVTFSRDTRIYGIPTVQISNGVDCAQIPVKKDFPEKQQLDLAVVANVSVWHGVDRVIAGLAAYQKESPARPVHLHIIGEGAAKKDLQMLTEKLGVSGMVTFYPAVFGEELDARMGQMDLGIASLAPHRKNVEEDSSLKTREYFARGLPCIGNERDSQILRSPLKKYFLVIPSDETPVDISAVVSFAQECVGPGQTVEIRKMAEQYLDWSHQMRTVLEAYERVR